MTRRNFFTVHSVVLLCFAIGFLVIPKQLLEIYGATVAPLGIVIARYLGTVQLANVFLSWTYRDLPASNEVRAFSIAMAFAWTMAGIITLAAQLDGIFNVLGWSTIVISLLLALGFVYFAFLEQESERLRPA